MYQTFASRQSSVKLHKPSLSYPQHYAVCENGFCRSAFRFACAIFKYPCKRLQESFSIPGLIDFQCAVHTRCATPCPRNGSQDLDWLNTQTFFHRKPVMPISYADAHLPRFSLMIYGAVQPHVRCLWHASCPATLMLDAAAGARRVITRVGKVNINSNSAGYAA